MAKIIAAFEGIEGAHSQVVLDAYFNSVSLEYEVLGVPSFRQIAQSVLSDKAHIGIVPIDNVIAGTVREGYDLLAEYGLEPFAEMVWRMDHRLIGVPGATLSNIREVLAHPLVIAECGKFLETLFGAKIIPWKDTGQAVKDVADAKDQTKVAIGPHQAAQRYGLTELAANIADHPDNYTRFLLFRSPKCQGEAAQLGGAVEFKDRKTSVLLTVSNEKGKLSDCLSIFSAAGVNLTKLESRPRPGKPFEVFFYVDFEGDKSEERIQHALEKLRKTTLEVLVVGSYDTYPPGNVKKPGAFAVPSPKQTKSEAATHLPEGALKNWPKAARPTKPEGTRIRVGNVIVGGNSFVVMAGPCSVESREQTMATAEAVKRSGAVIFRGGAFKPRTNPYAFQGLGWDGVKILCEAGRANGMPVISEVMSIDQVEPMARQVDILQIGARNMQNYDLLKEIGKTDRPVLLKRGLSASLDELLSAAEYILAGGNPNVMLCERGIRTFETSTRFTLDLNAVPVLRERTHLPVIIDPSHGVGVRRWIRPLCRAAKAVGAHGIIVEVHPNPAEAKSDKDQALPFDEFDQIMSELNEIPLLS